LFVFLEKKAGEGVAGVEDHAQQEGEKGDGEHVVEAGRGYHQRGDPLTTIFILFQC